MSRQLPSARPASSFSQRGVWLIEFVVAFVMMVMLLLAVLVIFDRSARIARDQSELAVIQQSSRVAHSEILRMTRMAGAGGLPVTWRNLPKPTPLTAVPEVTAATPGTFPNGFAVALQDNTAPGLKIPVLGTAEHTVIPGSDVLTVRGSFSLPMYYYPFTLANPGGVKTTGWDTPAGQIGTRALEIPNRNGKEYRSSLQPMVKYLEDEKNAGRSVIFIVRDLTNPDAYGILEWDVGSSLNRLTVEDCNTLSGVVGTQGAFDVGCIVVAVKFDPSKEYAKLMLGTVLEPNAGSLTFPMPGVPRGVVAFPLQFGSITVLEEFRYYVRAEYEVPGDNTSRLAPVLTRSGFVPSLDRVPIRANFVSTVDVVDGIMDFQVAAGIDQDWQVNAVGHGLVNEEPAPQSVTDPDNRARDEVLFNHVDDMATDPPAGLTTFDGQGIPGYIRWFHPRLDVYFVRLTTLAQSARADREFTGADIRWVENCDRTLPFSVDGKNYNYLDDRKYRRRLVQSVAELRNLK